MFWDWISAFYDVFETGYNNVKFYVVEGRMPYALAVITKIEGMNRE